MKKLTMMIWMAIEAVALAFLLFLCYTTIRTDTEQNKIFTQQSEDIAELQLQNYQLITDVSYLAERMTNLVDIIEQKAVWDEQVARKIRELDSTWRDK